MKSFRSIMYSKAFNLCAIFGLLALFISSCKEEKVHQQAEISFYHWKQDFSLDSNELAILSDNKVNELYVRFFDVTLQDGNCVPISVIDFNKATIPYDVIPCIYIENRVFEGYSSGLHKKIFELVSEIAELSNLTISEIQFDCDWTSSTDSNYFQFLENFQEISPWIVSSTLRLHQLKYPEMTGIPPVDKAVLMCYNMDDIYDLETTNSIISNNTLLSYVSNTPVYPLELDLALPAYHWGLVYRLDDLALIVNDIETASIPNYPFTKLSNTKYRADSSFYFNQTYFNRGDILRIENSSREVLLECAHTLKGSNQTYNKVIFYHLNSKYLSSYDESIFKEIADIIH